MNPEFIAKLVSEDGKYENIEIMIEKLLWYTHTISMKNYPMLNSILYGPKIPVGTELDEIKHEISVLIATNARLSHGQVCAELFKFKAELASSPIYIALYEIGDIDTITAKCVTNKNNVTISTVDGLTTMYNGETRQYKSGNIRFDLSNLLEYEATKPKPASWFGWLW